jgi:hypothetical protein
MGHEAYGGTDTLFFSTFLQTVIDITLFSSLVFSQNRSHVKPLRAENLHTNLNDFSS